MSFTLQDIQEAKKAVNSEEYVRWLKKIGVLSYDYDLSTGIFTYIGADGHKVVTESNGMHLEATGHADPERVQAIIEGLESWHNFTALCEALSNEGIATWETNLEHLEVEYRNVRGKAVYREQLPTFADEEK